MDNKTLLIEIGVEELPAIPLLKELPNIKNKWQELLKQYHLESEFEFFYTPRRLVLFHSDFKEKQDNSFIEIIGAPKAIAYKDGKLTNAGLSFLEKAGISKNELEFKEIKGKEVLYYQKEIIGLASTQILGEMIEKFIKSLHFGKSMRWGDKDFEFIRAIRSLACVFNNQLVEFEIFGVKSAKKTFVHRSVSYDLMDFKNTQDYFALLKKNYVLLDPKKREEKILKDFKFIEETQKITIAQDDELLAEVVAITEYPKALLGNFEKEFLEIPSEVIITSMRDNQRYFAVFNDNNLSNHFIVVSNAVCEDYSKVIHGNERVLRARLSDAMFFWQNDLKHALEPSKLSKMTYFEGLGSMQDKSNREKEVAKILCEMYRNDKKEEILKAIEYAKADLDTQMVYEFTELQGIMGSYYAKAMGLSYELCLALREQYLPNSDKSELPSTEFSSIVALANKIDTLMGLFAIGKIPSGTKDPYALRRAANGIIKIALKINKAFDLDFLFNHLAKNYPHFDASILKEFILERLYTFYDINASFIKAVLSSKNSDLVYIDSCIKALIEISKKDNFRESFSTFKRLANIATPSEAKVDESLFIHKAENNLYEKFKTCLTHNRTKEILESLFALKPQIDAFFDEVMINVEDEKLKANRQALIYCIYKEFLKIADIKELSL